MLHAITFVHQRASVIGMYGTSHRDRAFGIEQPVALVLWYLKIVGDDSKLLPSHFEHRPGVDRHESPPHAKGAVFEHRKRNLLEAMSEVGCGGVRSRNEVPTRSASVPLTARAKPAHRQRGLT
jgi:hypothetical protein